MAESRASGHAVYQSVFGRKRREPAGQDEAFDALTLDHLYGTIWSRPDLSIRDRSLVTVSILAALGREDELRTHIQGLRNQNFSRIQFTELMIHVAHYAGWPAGHNALQIVREVLDSHVEPS